MTLFEVDEAANRIRAEVDNEGYIVFGSTFSEDMEGKIRVSVVATGIDAQAVARPAPTVLSVIDRGAPSAAQKPDAEAPEHKLATVVKMVPPAAAATEPAPSVSGNAAPAAGETGGPGTCRGQGRRQRNRGLSTRHTGPRLPATSSSRRRPKPRAPLPTNPRLPLRRRRRRTRRPPRGWPGTGGPTLFERVTGTGRAAKSAKAALGDGDGLAHRHPIAGRGQLGGLDSTERVAVAQSEEDLLDIPAFLRRQAN